MREFLDEIRWLELAQARGLRLPKRAVTATPGNLERWLRRMGITPQQFCEWAGIKKLREWREMNPDWPMRAVGGLLLEWQESKRTGKENDGYTERSNGQEPRRQKDS